MQVAEGRQAAVGEQDNKLRSKDDPVKYDGIALAVLFHLQELSIFNF